GPKINPVFLFQSGARINISEGSSPERIVTITGPTEGIFRAFSMIAHKFEEVLTSLFHAVTANASHHREIKQLRYFHLNYRIKKAGNKGFTVTERSTGAQVQRAVTISGTTQAITQCVRLICSVMLESPPKGATIPYRPKAMATGAHAMLAPPHAAQVSHGEGKEIETTSLPLTEHLFSTAVLIFTVCLQFIGCIIGRQGSKINEIRQVSGAHIKIASAAEGSSVRQVTISGSPASISVAHYLISASLEMAKYTMQAAASGMDFNMAFSAPSSSSSSPGASALPGSLPGSLGAPHYAALPMSSLLGMKTVPVLAMHPSAALAQGLAPYAGKMPSAATGKKSERQKFAPY
uniref:K Homology domain-containing protein n=1 Tax=Neogobius melanostomus TaxID=47308 RepID=A0A8C6UT32_9GOBI